MTKQRDEPANSDLFSPALSQADWEAQGWSDEAAEATAHPRLEATISVRFDPDTARLLRSAARASGLTKSEFVRRSAIQSAREVLARQRPALFVRRAEFATTSMSGARSGIVDGWSCSPNRRSDSIVVSAWDITVEGVY